MTSVSLPHPRTNLRRLAGAGITCTGLVLLLWHCVQVWLLQSSASQQALAWQAATAAGALCALATALGALPVLLLRRLSAPAEDALLGFGAGTMLAAACYALLLPALNLTRALEPDHGGSRLTIAAALMAGALLMLALDRMLPHAHAHEDTGKHAPRLRLLVLAVTLHNLPEGLALGAAASAPDAAGAAALAWGMAAQDLPEGLVVALALRAAGHGARLSACVAAATGLVEWLAAWLGVALLAGEPTLLPAGLAFAAGAMLFVVCHEVIPAAHRRGHQFWATVGLLPGFALMLLLAASA